MNTQTLLKFTRGTIRVLGSAGKIILSFTGNTLRVIEKLGKAGSVPK